MSDLDPEAMAVAYDAIRDGEFNGIPPHQLSAAFHKAAINLRNDGYDTLGGAFDPGSWESVRTGGRVERFGECPICGWQHTYELLDPTDGDQMAFCSRDGTSKEVSES